MSIILASQSPRRRELMGLYKLPFVVRAADIDETMDPALSPFDAVAAISRKKAMAVPREGGDIVIAADTIVVCDGCILGKPKDEKSAKEMLCLLSGRTHQVMTGLTVLRGDSCISHTEVTEVTFRSLSQGEMDAYIASGEPMDKAGAYGIQGGAALFVTAIHGDYYNVVGLPVCKLGTLLSQILPAEDRI